MALINISDLNPAGSDLFAGAESFLTELDATETVAICGGGSKGGGSVPVPVIPVGGGGQILFSGGGGGKSNKGGNGVFFYTSGSPIGVIPVGQPGHH